MNIIKNLYRLGGADGVPTPVLVEPMVIWVDVLTKLTIYGSAFTADMTVYIRSMGAELPTSIPITGTGIHGTPIAFTFISSNEIEIGVISDSVRFLDIITHNKYGAGIWSIILDDDFVGVYSKSTHEHIFITDLQEKPSDAVKTAQEFDFDGSLCRMDRRWLVPKVHTCDPTFDIFGTFVVNKRTLASASLLPHHPTTGFTFEGALVQSQEINITSTSETSIPTIEISGSFRHWETDYELIIE